MRDKGNDEALLSAQQGIAEERGPATVLMADPRAQDPANAPDTARDPSSPVSSKPAPSSVEPATVPRGTQPLRPVVKTTPMALAVPLAPVITTAPAPGGAPLPYIPAGKSATMIMPAVPLPAVPLAPSPPPKQASTVLIPPALPIEPVAPIVVRTTPATDPRGSAPPSMDMALRPTAPAVEEALGLPPLPPPLPSALPEPLPAPIFDQETAAASLPRMPAPPNAKKRSGGGGRRVAIALGSLLLIAIIGAVASVALGFVRVPWRNSTSPKKTAAPSRTVSAVASAEVVVAPPPVSPAPTASASATGQPAEAPSSLVTSVVPSSAVPASASAQPSNTNWLDPPNTQAEGLLSFQGYLTVNSKQDADVYINGANAGRTNTRLLTRCGIKNIRLKGRDGMWKTDGAAVKIVCIRHTTITL